MDVTFQNVTITVTADTPQDAYTALCEALAPFEYSTDTYTRHEEDGVEPTEERDTTELFPSQS